MRVIASGYGAGDHDFPEHANVLRVLIGETSGAEESTTVAVLEANIDDSSPQVLGYAMERLLEAGALDVTLASVLMKKNRPGTLLSRDRAARRSRSAGAPDLRGNLHARPAHLFGRAPREGAAFGGSRDAARNSANEDRRKRIVRARIRRLPQAGARIRRAAQADPGRGEPRLSEKLSMKYYLTTPIYYVNAAPHLGTAYSTFAADLIKRFKKMEGFDPVVLTTGSDEHSRNVERAAQSRGRQSAERTPPRWRPSSSASGQARHRLRPFHSHLRPQASRNRALVCSSAAKRTATSTRVPTPAQYCVNDEPTSTMPSRAILAPTCGAPTETVTEENYFFKLSAFQEPLLELYEKNPEFVKPDHRRNEMIAFVQQGLNDLSITRTNIQWGIPVPVEGHHVFYVWFDALISYMSAVKDQDLWPADLHLIGKDILRFHAVYWPAFLMAADLPLPKQVFAHGWILLEENKMSKSRGNVVRPGPIVGRGGRRCAALFPAARNHLRAGRQLQLRRPDPALQRGSRERAGQSRQPHADDDPSVSRRRDSGFRRSADIAEAARRTTEHGHRRVLRFQFFERPGNAVGLDFGDRQIHRGARALEAGQGHVRVRAETAG